MTGDTPLSPNTVDQASPQPRIWGRVSKRVSIRIPYHLPTLRVLRLKRCRTLDYATSTRFIRLRPFLPLPPSTSTTLQLRSNKQLLLRFDLRHRRSAPQTCSHYKKGKKSTYLIHNLDGNFEDARHQIMRSKSQPLRKRNISHAIAFVDFDPHEVIGVGCVLDVMTYNKNLIRNRFPRSTNRRFVLTSVVRKDSSISSLKIKRPCRGVANGHRRPPRTAVEIQPLLCSRMSVQFP